MMNANVPKNHRYSENIFPADAKPSINPESGTGVDLAILIKFSLKIAIFMILP